MQSSELSHLKSSNHQAFEHYLRTGQRFTLAEWENLQERKYNHNHDERGRFTFSNNAMSGPTHRERAENHSAQNAPRVSRSSRAGSHHTTQPKVAGVERETTPFTQVGSYPARIYRTKLGAAIIDPRSGKPMVVPKGVSLQNTIRAGRLFGSPLNREPSATVAFSPGGPMDFQRTHSTLRDKHGNTLIDQRFIAIGNYNFGVYAAASGMSLDTALKGARAIYFSQTRRGFVNARNESLIVSGYRDYVNRNVGD